MKSEADVPVSALKAVTVPTAVGTDVSIMIAWVSVLPTFTPLITRTW
jgi:hypothetical protein